jgi:hypothetical protein
MLLYHVTCRVREHAERICRLRRHVNLSASKHCPGIDRSGLRGSNRACGCTLQRESAAAALEMPCPAIKKPWGMTGCTGGAHVFAEAMQGFKFRDSLFAGIDRNRRGPHAIRSALGCSQDGSWYHVATEVEGQRGLVGVIVAVSNSSGRRLQT